MNLKHFTIKKLLQFLLTFVLPMNVLAQTDSSNNFSWKSFFGKNLNPGISVGIGGARPYGFIPQPTLKIGRIEFEMSGFYYVSDREYVSSAQLGVEALKLTGYKGKPASLVPSVGLFLHGIETNIGEKAKDYFVILLGINQQMTIRSRLSLKVGALSRYSYTFNQYATIDRYTNEETKWFPYGEISYRLYTFPFGEKQFTTKDVYNTIKQTSGESIRNVLSTYFNPFISLGVGADRLFILPSIGLKVGPIRGKWGYNLAYAIAYDINVDLIKIGKSPKYQGYLGLGYNAISDYGMEFDGFTVNVTRYRKNGMHSMAFKLGIAQYYSFTHPGPGQLPSPGTSGYTFNGGISFNFHTFRFGTSKKDKDELTLSLN